MRRMSRLNCSNWKENVAAPCCLWKDHTSHREAARITEVAAKHRPTSRSENQSIYDQLCSLCRQLRDAFGGVLKSMMKELIPIKKAPAPLAARALEL